MIKINLLSHKRARRVDKGQQSLLLGVLVLLIAGAGVYFLVHRALAGEIEQLQADVSFMTRDNRDKTKQLTGQKSLQAAVTAMQERDLVIRRLNDARATPAYFLQELGRIMTSKSTPTMTRAMVKERESNPNHEYSLEWDPKHIWITSLTEKQGAFRLEGGAQSDSDMTQLALRLQASVFFHEVVPEGGTEFIDKDSGITYYKFTIAGKVAY